MSPLLLQIALHAIMPVGHARDTTISVFAAASLKDAFTEISWRYESKHPGTHVTLNFAGSQTLAAQISQGAPADVFASASMKNLLDANPDKASIRIFAENRLTIVARTGWPGLKSAKDLSRASKLVLADISVPAGKYAAEFLGKASKVYGANWLAAVNAHVVSRELDVRAVLAKVRLGEADAGIVYVSDAISTKGQVRVIPIPDRLNELAVYPVAVTAQPANKDGAKDFVKYLFASESQSTLEADGFISPLRAVSRLAVVSGKSLRTISLPLSSSYGITTIHVQGHTGKTESVKGVPVAAVLGRFSGTATIIAADGYSKTFKATDLARGKAVFVRDPDGNYGIVVAGFKPNWWVKWIRRIELSAAP